MEAQLGGAGTGVEDTGLAAEDPELVEDPALAADAGAASDPVPLAAPAAAAEPVPADDPAAPAPGTLSGMFTGTRISGMISGCVIAAAPDALGDVARAGLLARSEDSVRARGRAGASASAGSFASGSDSSTRSAGTTASTLGCWAAAAPLTASRASKTRSADPAGSGRRARSLGSVIDFGALFSAAAVCGGGSVRDVKRGPVGSMRVISRAPGRAGGADGCRWRTASACRARAAWLPGRAFRPAGSRTGVPRCQTLPAAPAMAGRGN